MLAIACQSAGACYVIPCLDQSLNDVRKRSMFAGGFCYLQMTFPWKNTHFLSTLCAFAAVKVTGSGRVIGRVSEFGPQEMQCQQLPVVTTADPTQQQELTNTAWAFASLGIRTQATRNNDLHYFVVEMDPNGSKWINHSNS